MKPTPERTGGWPAVRRICLGIADVGLSSPLVTSSRGSRTGGPQLLSPSLALLLVAFVCMAGLLVALISGHARGRWLIPVVAVRFVASSGATVLGLARRRNDVRDRHQVDCSLRAVEGACSGPTSQWRGGPAVIEQGKIRSPKDGGRYPPSTRSPDRPRSRSVGQRLGPTTSRSYYLGPMPDQ